MAAEKFQILAPRLLARRALLKIAAGGLGLFGLGALAWAFLESLSPSEAAKAAGAPVEVELADLADGQLRTVNWRGRPVWVLHRSAAMLDGLGGHDPQLSDPRSERDQQPAYAKNAFRSIKPEHLVLVGVCTHLGCTPLFRPEPGAADIAADWPGGFYCPCHGSRFDLAGRVFRNVPAPSNLEVPPYAYLDAGRLLIGVDTPHP